MTPEARYLLRLVIKISTHRGDKRTADEARATLNHARKSKSQEAS